MRMTDGVGFSSSFKGEGASGGLGTVVLGFDRQIRDRYVVGLFTEFDWSSIEMSYQDTDTPQQTFRLDRTFSLGGRAGFLLTPTSLLFMTAGYSWSHGKSNGYFDIESDDGFIFPGVRKLNLKGAFVGIGMETQLGRGLSLRGEVRYTMYQDKMVNSFNWQLASRAIAQLQRPLRSRPADRPHRAHLQVQPRRTARRTDQVAATDRDTRGSKGPALCVPTPSRGPLSASFLDCRQRRPLPAPVAAGIQSR